MCTKEEGIEVENAYKQSALWCTAWKMLKLHALSPSQTRKSIGVDHFLSVGNQMSMETGPMCMDKEAFEVSYAVRQVALMTYCMKRCWNCMHCHRQGQERSLGLIIPCPLATKWIWRRVHCTWLERDSRLVMQWNSCSPDESQEKQLKLHAMTTAQTRKSIGSHHSLAVGNQMSLETGTLCIDRERFKVGYAVKQLLPWWIPWKVVEIARSDDSTDKQKRMESIFLVLSRPKQHGFSFHAHQRRSSHGRESI